MISFFKKKITEADFGKGLIPSSPDSRDYLHKEIAGAPTPPNWQEKNPANFITYPMKNQAQTDACVAFAYAKQLEIDEFSENGIYRILSPRSIYPFGFVSPDGGMNDRQASTIVGSRGATLEFLLPSQNMTEVQMRDASDYILDAKQIALVYKPDAVVFADNQLDTIASIIETYRSQNQKKGVGIVVTGSNNGTWLSNFPQPPAPNETTWSHKVVATDYGLINGQKFISIDNSWGTVAGMNGKQFIGENYTPSIAESNYTLNLPDDWQAQAQSVPKPQYQWNTDLTLGASGQDVLMLQTALQSLGMFPISSVIKPTGYFGGITRNAVQLFQMTYNISPVTGIVGPLTRAKLNELFP